MSNPAIDYTRAISEVKIYRDYMALIRDGMNTGTPTPPEAMPRLATDYERVIRPYAELVGLSEPGEHDQHGYKFKYNNPVELAVKDWQFFHLNKAVQFLNLLIGRLEHHANTSAQTKEDLAPRKELDNKETDVLRALLEYGVTIKSHTIDIPISGLRLMALISETSESSLPTIIQSVCTKGYATDYKTNGPNLQVTLDTRLTFPTDLSDNDIEILHGNLIKRALLFYLYEKYKQAHHLKGAMTPLVPLATNLGTTQEQIQLYAQQLIDDGFIEYCVIDGGNYTCSLTSYGASVARQNSSLLKTFSGADMSIFKAQTKFNELSPAPTPIDPRKVFVVHGRNAKANKAMFSFLRAIGLDPIEWEEAIKMTGSGSPYIGEVLDVAFKHAQAIVVLFTGDDLAKLDNRLLDNNEQEEILTPQARPNVLFEAGMALGRNAKQTIIVELGELRGLSDIGGRHAIRLDNTSEKRQTLADRLKTAGCDVKLEGKTDWHKEGDFESTILPSTDTVNTHPASTTSSEDSFKRTLLKKLSDAYEVFNRDHNSSIPYYLTLVSDPVSSVTAIHLFEQWNFIARENAGMSATPSSLVNQILAITTSAIRAVNNTANLPKRNDYYETYGQLIIRFNEFAADLEKYLRETKSIHGCEISILRLPP